MNDDLLSVVTIDGPAGSGKSTVAKKTARRLGWTYLDTGAMYRCLCLMALRHDVDPEDESGLVELFEEMSLDMSFRDGTLIVRLNGEDVSQEIRGNDVSKHVSTVAAHEGVRDKLVDLQRAMGERGEAVVEGRDIGTVVFPDARYKFYLDAPLDIRARRRYNQLLDSGHSDVTFEAVLDDMRDRDETDRKRSAGPLKPPEDATIIDTADPSADEVVNRILQTLEQDS